MAYCTAFNVAMVTATVKFLSAISLADETFFLTDLMTRDFDL